MKAVVDQIVAETNEGLAEPSMSAEKFAQSTR
jgi:hypothetical protein